MDTKRLVPLLALVVSTLSAQTVWIAPPDTNLDVFLAQVSPGDVVYVSGVVRPFTLTKGVTLIGLVGVVPTYNQGQAVTTIAIPAGQGAHLVGLRFQDSGEFGQHSVQVDGDVDFEDCVFSGSYPASVTVRSGAVAMHHCVLAGLPMSSWGGCPGLRLEGGVCSLSDCYLRGVSAYPRFGTNYPRPSTPALEQVGGVLLASRVNAFGGDAAASFSSTYNFYPSPAFHCSGGVAYIVDSTLTGGRGDAGFASHPGAPALLGITTTAHARSTLTGGLGTVIGSPTQGPVVHVPELLGITWNHGLLLGLTATASITVGTSQPMLLYAGLQSGAVTLPGVIEPVFGPPGQLVAIAFALPQPGVATQVSIQVPALPSLRGIGLRLQALQLAGSGARASAAVGSVLR